VRQDIFDRITRVIVADRPAYMKAFLDDYHNLDVLDGPRVSEQDLHLSWNIAVIASSRGTLDCCDQSKNKHATKHFHVTNHPIMQSFEPGEDWRWCYIDELLV